MTAKATFFPVNGAFELKLKNIILFLKSSYTTKTASWKKFWTKYGERWEK